MYCSNCGRALSGRLNFCNSCGEPTDRNVAADGRNSRMFVISGTFIVVFALLVFYPLLRTLLNSGLDPQAIAVILLAYMGSIVVMFSVMMGMAWKQMSAPSHRRIPQDKKEAYLAPASFRGVDTSQLSAGDPGWNSVTDSTTGTLDEVSMER